MRNLARRIAAAEARLGSRRQGVSGAYEVHFTEARRKDHREDIKPCAEADHGPSCGVQVFPIDAPIRRMVVLRIAWEPLV
jgi:hypothetical protein